MSFKITVCIILSLRHSSVVQILWFLHVWATARVGQTSGPGWRLTSCFCPAAWPCGRAGPAAASAESGWPEAGGGTAAAGPPPDAPCWELRSCCRARRTESCLRDRRVITIKKYQMPPLFVSRAQKGVFPHQLSSGARGSVCAWAEVQAVHPG